MLNNIIQICLSALFIIGTVIIMMLWYRLLKTPDSQIKYYKREPAAVDSTIHIKLDEYGERLKMIEKEIFLGCE